MDHPENPTEPADPTPEGGGAGRQVLAGATRLARRWRSIPTGRPATDELVIGPGQRILRFVIAAAAMMPAVLFWAPAALVTLLVGLVLPLTRQNATSTG